MTPPMRKGQAVRRAAWLGVGAAVAAATLARRRPAVAVAAAAGAALAGAAAFMPANPAFGRAIARGPRDRPRAALTFDDGPGPSTPAVLDALAERGRARDLLRPRPPGRAPPRARAPHRRRRPPARQPRLRPRDPDLPRRGARRGPAAPLRARRRGGRGGGRDVAPVPRAPRVPRARHRDRSAPRGLPDGGLDPRRLRLRRPRRGRHRPSRRPRRSSPAPSCCCTTPTGGRRSAPASRPPTPCPRSAAPRARAGSSS